MIGKEIELFYNFLNEMERMAARQSKRVEPERVAVFLKENPVIVDSIAEVAARYNHRLIYLGMDSGRAGDLAKSLSNAIWSTVLENVR